MSKWLSDEEVDYLEEYRFRAAAVPSDIDNVFVQAKEANRLRDGLEQMKRATAERRNYYSEKADTVDDQTERSHWAGMSEANEDFIDDLNKLLEGE